MESGIPEVAAEDETRIEAKRQEYVRRLLWSARNHLAEAQAKANDVIDSAPAITPSEELQPFVHQEIAIHAGTACQLLLKSLVVAAGRGDSDVRKRQLYRLLEQATHEYPDVSLHKNDIQKVNSMRNWSVHDGKAPDLAGAVSAVNASVEFAAFVNKVLRAAEHPVLDELDWFGEFQDSEAMTRAMEEYERAVRKQVRDAAAAFSSKYARQDQGEVAAAVDLGRGAWLSAADPASRYEDLECPACLCAGFVILDVGLVEVGGDVVENAQAKRFYCVACGLDLPMSEWQFAGLVDTYSDIDPYFFLDFD